MATSLTELEKYMGDPTKYLGLNMEAYAKGRDLQTAQATFKAGSVADYFKGAVAKDFGGDDQTAIAFALSKYGLLPGIDSPVTAQSDKFARQAASTATAQLLTGDTAQQTMLDYLSKAGYDTSSLGIGGYSTKINPVPTGFSGVTASKTISNIQSGASTFQYVKKDGTLGTFSAANQGAALANMPADADPHSGVMATGFSSNQPPSGGGTYSPSYGSVSGADYLVGKEGEVSSTRKALEDELERYKEEAQREKEKYEKLSDQYAKQTESTIKEGAPEKGVFYDERMGLIQGEIEAAEHAQEYKIEIFDRRMNAVNEIEKLWTQAANEIHLLESQTGLASIRSPRVNAAVNHYNMLIDTQQALIQGLDGQAQLAQGYIDKALAYSQQMRGEELAYYQGLANFYSGEEGKMETRATNAQREAQAWAETQINLLIQDEQREYEAAQEIKRLLTDPETAKLAQDAGVHMGMSAQEIAYKIAVQQDIQNTKDTNNELLLEGYTPASAGAAGAIPITMPDGTTKYYKAPPEGGKTYAPSEYEKEWTAAGGLLGTGLTLSEWIMARTDTVSPKQDLTSKQIREGFAQNQIATRDDALEALAVDRPYITDATAQRYQAVIDADFPAPAATTPSANTFLGQGGMFSRLFGWAGEMGGKLMRE